MGRLQEDATVSAVVFDWGGVIQRTVDAKPRRDLERELGLPLGEIDRAVFECDIWREASIGRVSADEAWHSIAASVGVTPRGIEGFVERFFSGDRVDEKLVALIRDLRASGYPVALLSNAPPGRTSGSTAGRWGMDGLFDVQVFSYEVGALKPHPAMYKAVISALDVPAHRIAFIDDSAANVEGAARLGLQAIRYRGNAALFESLRRLGVTT